MSDISSQKEAIVRQVGRRKILGRARAAFGAAASMISYFLPIAAMAFASLVTGCQSDVGFGSGGGGMGGVRISITEVSGSNQVVASGGDESEPIVVRADLDDSPIDGITIGWEITEGDGSLSSSSSVTDEGGYAQTTYISGDNIGEVEIVADRKSVV